MYASYRDPRAMRYWSTPPHDTITLTQELLDRRIADWAQHRRNFQITYNGAYIGHAGMFRDNEIRFMLSPEHWQKGFMSETMAALIPYLFTKLSAPYLTADADPLNSASCAALKKLGFRETHHAKNTFCINGVWSDSVYFRLDHTQI